MANDDSSKFNVDKYSKDENGGHLRAPIAPYADAADSLANRQQMVISFMHESSGNSVYFKAFITALNETYNSDWVSEHAFGRVDPIKIFRSTERKITLTFKVPAATESEAYENLARIQTLTQFLYPTYVDLGGQAAQLMGQAPLVRLKVMNIVQKNVAPKSKTGKKKKFEFASYRSDMSAEGLLGAINNVQINHNLENIDANVIQKDKNTILPTYIDVSVDFSPIHEHAVGWNEKGEALTANFPYGVNSGLTKQAADAQEAGEAFARAAGADEPFDGEIANAITGPAGGDGVATGRNVTPEQAKDTTSNEESSKQRKNNQKEARDGNIIKNLFKRK